MTPEETPQELHERLWHEWKMAMGIRRTMTEHETWNEAIEAAAKDVELKEGSRTPYLADSIRLLKKATK